MTGLFLIPQWQLEQEYLLVYLRLLFTLLYDLFLIGPGLVCISPHCANVTTNICVKFNTLDLDLLFSNFPVFIVRLSNDPAGLESLVRVLVH